MKASFSATRKERSRALADRKAASTGPTAEPLPRRAWGIEPSAQTKLLRAIEGQGFTPVGGSDLHKPNFRIIAATNRNLAERVASGQMREDFFYRIHVIPIHLPPLRQRKEDIPLLIEYFLNAYPRVGDLPALNGEVMQAFMQYDWPGNIRELHNTLYRYLTLGKVQLGTLQVGSGQLPAGGQTGTGEAEHRQALPQEPLASALDRFEREYLLETLRRNDWKRAETADILGIDRRTLFRKIKQFDLEDEEANSPVQETPRLGFHQRESLWERGLTRSVRWVWGTKGKAFPRKAPLPQSFRMVSGNQPCHMQNGRLDSAELAYRRSPVTSSPIHSGRSKACPSSVSSISATTSPALSPRNSSTSQTKP